jgi:hypothetical protein
MLSLVGGCSVLFAPDAPGSSGSGDGGSGDGGDIPDADPGLADATSDCSRWGTRHVFDACEDLPPAGPDVFLAGVGEWQFDTDTLTLGYAGVDDPIRPTLVAQHVVQTSTRATAVISASRFEIGPFAKFRAVGSRPLIVASWSDINVHGRVDVSTYDGLDDPPTDLIAPGAGAIAGCSGVTLPGLGGLGGGGGGMQTAGGDGGDASGAMGDKGGDAIALTDLRGGCSGTDGDPPSTFGRAGRSGGGVLLTAIGEIAVGISAEVVAGGGGGAGGMPDPGGGSATAGGGGGGGSGGMVALEAPVVHLFAGSSVNAAGGGGGGGGGASGGVLPPLPGRAGAPGYAANSQNDVESSGGSGGNGVPAGRPGGNGSRVLGVSGQSGGDATSFTPAGAGGGGGGVGRLVIWGEADIRDGADLTPDAIVVP